MPLIEHPETIEPSVSEILVLLDLNFGIDDVEPTTALLAGGYLDSLGLLELISCLEEGFNLVLEDEDLSSENFATAEAIAELVGARS